MFSRCGYNLVLSKGSGVIKKLSLGHFSCDHIKYNIIDYIITNIIFGKLRIILYLYSMEHKISVTDKSYHKAILQIYNFNLKLSDFELDIISTMLTYGMLEINPDTKEIIRKVLDKDKFITNNYIKRLKDKGVLLPKEDQRGYTLNPNIANLTKDNKISFEFITV